MFYAQSSVTIISERQTDRESDRQTESVRQRQTGRERDGDRESERDRHRENTSVPETLMKESQRKVEQQEQQNCSSNAPRVMCLSP